MLVSHPCAIYNLDRVNMVWRQLLLPALPHRGRSQRLPECPWPYTLISTTISTPNREPLTRMNSILFQVIASK